MIADYKKTSHKHRIGAMLLVAALAFIVLTNAYVAKADFTFGTPANLGQLVNSSSEDGGPYVSPDGLELYIFSNRPGGAGGYDAWVATRPSARDPWGESVNLGPPVNTSSNDGVGCLSADGLEMYFDSNRAGGAGNWDIWMTTRRTKNDPWEEAVNLGPTVNSSDFDCGATVTADGLSLYFQSDRPGGSGGDDIWVTSRASKDDRWEPPVNLGPTVNSVSWEWSPRLSLDGLSLFFCSNRPGGYGGWDLYVAKRVTTRDTWGPAMNLGSMVNSSSNEYNPAISPDGAMLYFDDWGTNRPDGLGKGDIWQAEIFPVVDFNGDGVVDCVDICMMMEYWDTNEPLYDIAPVPFGDGVVDVQDLIVLTQHLTKNQAEPTR